MNDATTNDLNGGVGGGPAAPGTAAAAQTPAAPAPPQDAAALPAAYPFAALTGQQALQQALLLVAVDPGIGGVLISGPRGTAKSTAARALAELLPEGRFVTLPLSASDEQVTGSLDLASALADHTVRFAPGLIARAHRGVLYVDEINLLPDALVDALLDAAASGIHTVERDGISHSHPARFALVGTMNPEEGELRPQLLDRFGLMVEVGNCNDAVLRQQIVRMRLAFDLDAHAFREQYRDAQAALVARIRAARAALPALAFSDAAHARAAALCIDAAVDGLRGDLVMLRAARALAALEGATSVDAAHVERVAADVLRHRRTRPDSDTAGADDAAAHAARRAPAADSLGQTPSNSSGRDASSKQHDDDARIAHAADHDDEPPPFARAGSRAEAGDPAHAGARAPSGADGANRPVRDTAAQTRPDAASSADRDWGHLPPEPVGMAPAPAVKRVIALPLKKR
ncbi:ATP-binding protein [Burkholderia singularis]|uniref:ChlI component of cobalt chelatase involved in B12 biosynthesis n=1 Tax=Burkholderia singularis TaxID=1503053 RepID=A0A238H5K6_9BURK|nr:ChlI component of cobalt chelatase involved in B12 biosynthesis [Burkholderia singularis]